MPKHAGTRTIFGRLKRTGQGNDNAIAATVPRERVGGGLAVAHADPIELEMESVEIETDADPPVERRFVVRSAVAVVASAAQHAAVADQADAIGQRLREIELAVNRIAETAKVARRVIHTSADVSR